jgi:putative ABC transport system permease protein
MEHYSPPQLPLRFFRWFCHAKLRDSIEGDLMELYFERVKKLGKRKADIRFIIDVMLLFRPGIIKPIEGYKNLNNYGMYKSYLKTGWRTLLKSKVHAFINISGLALGIASVFLMTMYVKHELGYDRYYDQYENLYRITWENENPQTRTPHPMAQVLVNDFPEVESAVSLSPLWGAGLTRRTFSVRNLERDLRFDETNVLAVDTTFFDVFRFSVVRGDGKKALQNVNGLLLSESTAKKYFGNDDPIGKHLAVNSDSVLLEVMAIFKDVPEQSHFHFDMLVSYVREKSFDPENEYYTWADFGHFNYVRLKPGADHKALEAKLLSWVRKYINISDEYFRRATANNIGFRVQPLTDIHLKSHLRWELETNGNIEYVYIMMASALLTLIVACINFMNLMTAKSTERSKEIGIRKALGALRRQLSFQFLSESLIVTIISIAIAVLLVETSLPFYNSLTGHSFVLHYQETVPLLIVLSIAVALLAGIYPSLFLSSVQPHAVLKGKLQGGNKGNKLRSALIVFQFAISMMLISGGGIIFSQLDYIQNKNLGFDKEEVVIIPIKDRSVSRRMETLKAELMKIDGVSSISASSNLPGGQFNQNSVTSVTNPEDRVDFSEAFVDYDFLKTMNIELAEGRFFLPQNQANTSIYFVINETGAKHLNLVEAVGKEINWEADGRVITGQVIGVMKDFHFHSIHHSVQPLLFILYPAYNHVIVKMNTQDFETKIAQVKEIYAQFDDAFDFEFSFLDDRLDQQYKTEQRTGVVFGIFAFIAVIIACFGLFGMAMITFHQRTKEVSIRKVLGAPVQQVIVLLLSDFTKLIFLAILMAVPLAWWVMDKWLDNFTYHVGIHPAVFLISGLMLIFISWITLSYLTLKASRINPAETLKNE